MSKENVFTLFAKASENEQLKHQLQDVSSFSELVEIGKKWGLNFSSDDVKNAITDTATRPGFLSNIIRAALNTFSPDNETPPSIGVQPYSGDPNSER